MAPKASSSRVKTDDSDSDDIDRSSLEGTPAPVEAAAPRAIPDYNPPEGYRAVSYGKDVASADFDFDDFAQDDDVELWLVRVPSALKPKYLDGVGCPAPGQRSSFKVKKRHYTVSDAPAESEKRADVLAMLPSKAQDNRLLICASSKKIARRIHIEHDRRDKQPEDDFMPLRKPARERHVQPKGLHYTFTPFSAGPELADEAKEQPPTKKRKKS